MKTVRSCLIALWAAVLSACSAMQGKISSDEVYTSRGDVFRMNTPRPYNLRSPNYPVRDASWRDGAVTVDFFASPYSQGDKVHYTVGYSPLKAIELRWPIADRALRSVRSYTQDPDIFQKFFEEHLVHVQCVLQRTPGVPPSDMQSQRILLRDIPLRVGDTAVHYSVFTRHLSTSPGWRMDGPRYLYFGVYIWQVGGGMMWVLIMADPGRSMVHEEIPTAESLRTASQVEADRRLVASIELLKPPPARDLGWLEQDVARSQNWCSSIQ